MTDLTCDPWHRMCRCGTYFTIGLRNADQKLCRLCLTEQKQEENERKYNENLNMQKDEDVKHFVVNAAPVAAGEIEHRINLLATICNEDIVAITQKEREYGGSWKKRGGIGAYMMACRKFDRLEEQVKRHGYDLFAAVAADTREEGILDDIRDLRRYLTLFEAEFLRTGVIGGTHPVKGN